MLSDGLETFTIELLSTYFNPLPFVVTSLFRMLSDGLETFTIELLSTYFNPLPFVVTSLFY